MNTTFSPSYKSCRQRFLSAVQYSEFRLESLVMPKKGREDETLAMDVAVGGNEHSENIVVCFSGVHGAEGFAGSACQSHFLENIAPKVDLGNVKILLVHGVNPYGFSYLRRTNENNVDMNRNFVDFSKFRSDDHEYQELHKVLLASEIPNMDIIEGPLGEYVALQGASKFQEILAKGQYSESKGLFYGGTQAQWSRLTLEKVLLKEMVAAKKVAFLDIHTGLGPEGYGELIFNGSPQSQAYQFSAAMFGNDVKATHSGEAVATSSTGLVQHVFDFLDESCLFASSTLEYGTVEFANIVNALRSECWQYFYGTNESTKEKAREQMKSSFYVQTHRWEQAVLARFSDVITRALHCMAGNN